MKAKYRGREAIIISNDRVELTVLPLGGGLPSIVLKDDSERVNPMWDSLRDDQNSGRPLRNTGAVGHFTCVDGFGPTSEEEAAAGAEGHGEAHRLPWVTVSSAVDKGIATLRQAVTLPRVHETFTRTISLRDGEQVFRVDSTLESLLGFDRPVNWAEHATIGSPFLEPGVTVVDLSSNRAMVRPKRGRPPRNPHRLAVGEEFEWPLAPRAGGSGKVDLRAAPAETNSLDHTGHLMTPSGKIAWATALHPNKRLLIGYVFKTAEFPWLQIWEHYPPEGLMARGLEFGTQPFDLPRREMVTSNRLFGELLYRWLPAKSTIETSYLLFWTRAPEGFLRVDELAVAGGKISLHDRRSGKELALDFAGEL